MKIEVMQMNKRITNGKHVTILSLYHIELKNRTLSRICLVESTTFGCYVGFSGWSFHSKSLMCPNVLFFLNDQTKFNKTTYIKLFTKENK